MMTKTCVKCKHQTTITVFVDWQVFICPSCGTAVVNKGQNDNILAQYTKFPGKLKRRTDRSGLMVGDTCEIDKVGYCVIGLIQKRNAENYTWYEYILKSEQKDYLFISESNGHWVMLEEYDQYSEVYEATQGKVNIEGKNELKTSYTYEVVTAQGFFDFYPLNSGTITETAKPPYLYSLEVFKKEGWYEQHYYFGQHVKRSRIKKWFPKSFLPSPTGVGIVQPFAVNLVSMAYVFLVTILLLFATNLWYYWNDSNMTTVYNSKLEFAKGQDFSSTSFDLNGRTGTLQFDFYSPVDNNWASCDIALVNEKNGDKKFFSKDIEYYYGTDGGESWAEGSRQSRAYVCGVIPGKYHLEFSVSHDTKSANIASTGFSIDSSYNGSTTVTDPLANSFIDTKVSWKKPTLWNLNFIAIGLLVILIIVFIVKGAFENKRKYYNFD